MCETAPPRKRTRKMTQKGTSGMMEGTPPREAVVGGYGGELMVVET